MKRKLVLVNLALLMLTAAAGMRLRDEWRVAKARERAILRQAIQPAPPPPLSPLPPSPKVTPADYIEIAEKMLFSKDRNPVVVVETSAPPPPKPMPPLPVFHGLMNLGDGPTAMMSAKAGAAHVDVRFGERIGDFTLVSVENDEVILEWEGQSIRKTRRELAKTDPPGAPATAAPVAASAPAPAAAPKLAGPGVDTGGGIRACVSGDASPSGTVVDGMKKVVIRGMFGPECHWEKVK